MQTGRTNQSATLRRGPSMKEPMIDELEPGYPLVIYGAKGGWLEVVAKAKGPRTNDQPGWMAARLVDIDLPAHPPPLKPRGETRTILYVALVGFAMFLALLFWI